MTRTKFYITRFLQLFGSYNRRRHLTAAASETQLYAQAQQYFGATVWPDAEKIDAISTEYWTLRSLESERKELLSTLEKNQGTLEKTQGIRETTVTDWRTEIENLENQRREAVAELGRMRPAIYENRENGKRIKKTYEDLKMQYEVIGDSDENEQARLAINKRMDEARKKFEELKEKDIKLVEAKKAQEKAVKSTEERLAELRSTLKKRALKAYSTIGQANQDTSEAKAKIKRLDREMSRLHTQIGRYILGNARSSPEVRQLISKHKLFYSQIRLLEQSINYNHSLSDLG